MTLRDTHLRAFLTDTLNGSISVGEMASFVQLSRGLIQAYLSAFRPGSLSLCERQGISFTDLAYDCIADLFSRNSEGEYGHLKSFAESLHTPLDRIPEHELIATFRSILSIFADAQLVRLFALSDPAGAKIYRNIREGVKKGDIFRLVKDLRGWVLTPTDVPAMDGLPPADIEMVRSAFIARLGPTRFIPQLLSTLHDVLLEQSGTRRSIPLIDAVHIVREVFLADTPVDGEPLLPSPDESLLPGEIDGMRKHVELALKERILLTYVVRGKLSTRQAEAIVLAFRDIIDEWCQGDHNGTPLRECLSRHVALDANEYESTYRVKMEYLLHIARAEFASRLLREL